MKSSRRVLNGTTLRRFVQVAALLTFFALVLLARRQVGVTPGVWLQGFFLLDPLVLAMTWLSGHAVPVLLLVSLGTVAVTVLAGRVFCGWFCPLGTLNAIAGRVLEFFWPRKPRPQHWSRWQLTKYYLLAAILVMAAFGVHWGALLDPLVLLYRTTVVGLLPGVQWALEDGSAALGLSEPVRQFLREHVTEVERQAFLGSSLIVGLFLVILGLNRLQPRFWCRYLCPLGAMLGALAVRPFLQRRTLPSQCNQCDLCGLSCHGAAAGSAGAEWHAAECFGCLNCTPACRQDGLAFRLVRPWQRDPIAGGEVVAPSKAAAKAASRSRRRFVRGVLGGAAGGLAGMFLLRATPQARGSIGSQLLVRPPGSLPEREFLSRCTGCGMCMRICPTGCLQPTLAEAGLEGLWTPHAVARIGRCENDCILCGNVCPTGAIRPLTVDQKRAVKIGIAVIDQSRCIPFAYGRDCGTCVEACALPEKALRLVDVEIQVNTGTRQRTKVVSQPMVDPDLCTGCGGCVKECTFKDEPAIHVYSANETRFPFGQPFLNLRAGTSPPAPAAQPAADPSAESDPYAH
ncbi:MAG: 4Fe-4S binding protein [Thermoguttaceae bacterium]